MSRSGKGNRPPKAGEGGPGRSFRVLGGRLGSLRLARGWTQLEAAERAGISERLIRKAEAGESLGVRSISILVNLYSTAQSPLTLDDVIDGTLSAVSDAAGIEAIVRRWHHELWSLGRLEILGELAAADCILHVHDKHLRGHSAVRRYIRATRAAVGECMFVAHSPAIFGDLAVSRWRVRLKDSPLSLPDHPVDERSVIRGSTWIRLADGLLCEVWKYWHFPFPMAKPTEAKG